MLAQTFVGKNPKMRTLVYAVTEIMILAQTVVGQNRKMETLVYAIREIMIFEKN